jgi:glutamine amidotransferase
VISATILDYGAGNLHSLRKALMADGIDVRVVDDVRTALDTDVLVLPGVGSFPFAAARLDEARDELRRRIAGGLPTIGICLGMQLLFERSEEGAGVGLGVLAGEVTRLRAKRVPHIGWNRVDLAGGATAGDMYFANSFACRPVDARDVIAWAGHETDRFPAMVRRGRVIGMQFHPEKSSVAGVRLLRDLLREVAV